MCIACRSAYEGMLKQIEKLREEKANEEKREEERREEERREEERREEEQQWMERRRSTEMPAGEIRVKTDLMARPIAEVGFCTHRPNNSFRAIPKFRGHVIRVYTLCE